MLTARFQTGVWTPAQEGDLRLWLDASVASTITLASTQVATWASRVRGVSVSRPGTSGPTYGATAWNGSLPAVTFNGSGYSDLRASSVSGLTDFYGDSVNASLVARIILPSGGSGSGFLFQSYTAGGAIVEHRFLDPNFNLFWSSGGAHANGTASYSRNTAYTFSSVITTPNVATYKDSATADIASTGISTSTVDSFSIGAGALLGNNPLFVKVAEFMMFKSALSTAAIQKIHAYLAAKWP